MAKQKKHKRKRQNVAKEDKHVLEYKPNGRNSRTRTKTGYKHTKQAQLYLRINMYHRSVVKLNVYAVNEEN